MSRLRDLPATLLALAVPCTHILFGVFVALIFMPEGERLPDPATPPGYSGRVQFSEDRGKVRASVAVPASDVSTVVALETESGKKLANLIVFGNGALTLESMKSDPTRFVLYRDSQGAVSLGVCNHPRVRLQIDASAQGLSNMVVYRLEDGAALRVVRVTKSEF